MRDQRARPSADPAVLADRIAERLRVQLGEQLHRRGFVVAMSGGVDSTVCCALAVRAIGRKHVVGIFLPERDSDPDSRALFEEAVARFGVSPVVEDISPILDAAGCYRRRDEAIRRVVPEFGPRWGCKLVLASNLLETDRLNVTQLTVKSPEAEERTVRLPADVYRAIVAASNFKQRVRAMLTYYHADRLHFAVLGTPNRLEYDQGFFVKGGDGLADVKPIAHLYKNQVYELADFLGVPDRVRRRPPTTDTYSLPQTQEEFYFGLQVRLMDEVLHAFNEGCSAESTAVTLGLTAPQVERLYRDIRQKRSTTRYLHTRALLVDSIPEIHDDIGDHD